MNKINRFVNHLKRGTLFRRLDYEKVKRKALIAENKWEALKQTKQKEITCRLFNLYNLVLHRDSNFSKNIFRGDFEFHEIKFLLSFLRKGDLFIDVGANIGYFSIAASKQVGKEGKVIAFEPTEIIHQRLQHSISLNQCTNVKSEIFALSDKNEERAFKISKDGFDAYNSLGHPSQGSQFETKAVQTKTLDDYIKENKLSSISLIKVDVEGWEIPVIKGMKNLLKEKNAPVLLIEFTEDNARLSGFTCQELFYLIESFGYELFLYNWVKNELVKQKNRDYFSYTNLVCIKDKNFVKKRLKNILII